MAHEIEIHADGTASFVSAREDAWHRLGTVTQGALSAQEALGMAFLAGWNVRKLPLTAAELSESGVCTLDVGDPVNAAGEAEIAGSSSDGYFGLDINTKSGHFLPDSDSLSDGVDAFCQFGIDFPDAE